MKGQRFPESSVVNHPPFFADRCDALKTMKRSQIRYYDAHSEVDQAPDAFDDSRAKRRNAPGLLPGCRPGEVDHSSGSLWWRTVNHVLNIIRCTMHVPQNTSSQSSLIFGDG